MSVAKEMAHPEAAHWIPALLYHEMCHAVLGQDVGQRGTKRTWHGQKFRELEARHPQSKDLDHWIKSGGWLHVVRSARAKTSRSKHIRLEIPQFYR